MIRSENNGRGEKCEVLDAEVKSLTAEWKYA